MTLKKTRFTNYRSFEQYEIEFGEKTTLLIGRNGMGKTNLLSGIVQSLSFIFSKQRNQPQYEFIASSDQGVKPFSINDVRYHIDDYKYPVEIACSALIGDPSTYQEVLKWSLRQEGPKSGLRDSLFRVPYHTFWEYYMTRNEKPVLAFFSDGFPHKNTRISKSMKDRLESGNPLPSNTGYYQWDEEQSCVEIWKTYYKMQWMNNNSAPNQERSHYIEAVNQALVEFSMPLNGGNEEMEVSRLFVETRGEKNVLMIEMSNGERKPYDSLPQGYNRLFSMVFDLANRSYLLNRHCNPEGIAIIDEIELHLHPSLAAEVLQRLRRSFPRMQFIASTHSPLVIANFNQSEGNSDDNRLYSLYKTSQGYDRKRILDLYGMDYATSLSEVMGTPSSLPQMDKWKRAYLYWQGQDEIKAARIAEEIKREFPNSRIIQELNL